MPTIEEVKESLSFAALQAIKVKYPSHNTSTFVSNNEYLWKAQVEAMMPILEAEFLRGKDSVPVAEPEPIDEPETARIALGPVPLLTSAKDLINLSPVYCYGHKLATLQIDQAVVQYEHAEDAAQFASDLNNLPE